MKPGWFDFAFGVAIGLTIAQAREMALGCVPPDAELREMPNIHDQIIYDAGCAYHDRACRKFREAIEAAFKEPT